LTDSKKPSKFSVPSMGTDEDIWNKILETLRPQDMKEAELSESIISEPYFGHKEILVKRRDGSNIAFASLSERHENFNEWSVYYEC
tara:strand:+ start:769 stop:1026 length:258 start_codon:yes stop_codon:yes gene_type:complete